MIPVFKPLITKDERKAADKSLEIGWLGMGKYVNKFENKIKSIIGNKKKYVISVNTGHSALHLIMMLIGLKKGDEVITPSFNNIADIQAIIAVGAKPVFCDILEEDLCIDIKKAEKLINKKTGKGGRQGERVYDITNCGPTICASSGGPGAKTGLYYFDGKIRTLSVNETLKMFGFDNTYKYRSLLNKKKMLFYLGNSIVVNVLEELIKDL